MNKSATNSTVLKSNNRSLLLGIIRKGNVSRAELSRATGLTKSAVTAITNKLINEGILYETGTSISVKGRRPILLDIVKNHKYAIGVLLHRDRVALSIIDLQCNLVDSIEKSIALFHNSDEILDYICENIDTLLAKTRIDFSKVLGIGISSPGPLNYISGKILNPPNLDIINNLSVVDVLREKYHLPIFLENNAVLLGLTEYFYGVMSKYSNAMFVTLTHGIGSVIIENGSVYRGKGGYAGELGHISVNIDGELCPCGNHGCLELYASLEALEKRFHFSQKNFDQIVNKAYAGDSESEKILHYEARYLAVGIVNAVNLFDLDAVVLHGIINYRPEILISEIRSIVNSNSFISSAHKIDILSSSLGDDAQFVACAASVLNNFF